MTGRIASVWELTEREREAMRWQALGYSQAEIGERMGVTLATVNRHLYSARQKLGITNRHVTVMALKLGIIEMEEALGHLPQGTKIACGLI